MVATFQVDVFLNDVTTGRTFARLDYDLTFDPSMVIGSSQNHAFTLLATEPDGSLYPDGCAMGANKVDE